uniref:Ovule protein n=1 Tax=Heterorhabditis bacteriophora TaxID=37862 RepID=A0A1I7WWQ8_HETBA
MLMPSWSLKKVTLTDLYIYVTYMFQILQNFYPDTLSHRQDYLHCVFFIFIHFSTVS